MNVSGVQQYSFLGNSSIGANTSTANDSYLMNLIKKSREPYKEYKDIPDLPNKVPVAGDFAVGFTGDGPLKELYFEGKLDKLFAESIKIAEQNKDTMGITQKMNEKADALAGSNFGDILLRELGSSKNDEDLSVKKQSIVNDTLELFRNGVSIGQIG